jgi:hypothetical protein
VVRRLLARLSPRDLLNHEVMLLAVKAYFDGSISSSRVALAGIVADENTWGEVEGRWEEVRKARGNPPFIHMTYLMALQEIYKDWSEDERDYLVDGLLNVLLFFRVGLHVRLTGAPTMILGASRGSLPLKDYARASYSRM